MPARRTIHFTTQADFKGYYRNRKLFGKREREIIECLLKKDVLPLLDGMEIAAFFGVSQSALRSVLIQPDSHYRRFRIRKKASGWRQICAPRDFLSGIQSRLLSSILSKIKPHKAAHAYMRGTSTLTCARPHKGNRYLWNVDLKDFFRQVTSSRVEEVFLRIGYPESAARFLAKLCTYRDELPQGSQTSPALSNLVFQAADSLIASLCRRNKVAYTRYGDDLSFSSDEPLSEDFQQKVESILNKSGFKLNPLKSRLMGPACQRKVVGVVVNQKLSLPRTKRREIRALFHRAAQHPDEFEDRHSELAGLANWVRGFHPKEGAKYLLQIQRITLSEHSS